MLQPREFNKGKQRFIFNYFFISKASGSIGIMIEEHYTSTNTSRTLRLYDI